MPAGLSAKVMKPITANAALKPAAAARKNAAEWRVPQPNIGLSMGCPVKSRSPQFRHVDTKRAAGCSGEEPIMIKIRFSLLIAASALMIGGAVIANEHEDGAAAKDHPHPKTVEEMKPHMQQMNQHAMQVLGSADKEYDRRFMELMIEHHKGGISMAKDAVQKAQHPELKKKAEEMIRMQEKDNQQMQQWLQDWFGDTKSTQ